MKIKDSTIVILLILTWLFIVCGVLGAENEISRMEEQIKTAYGQQDELLRITSELVNKNNEQDQRLDDVEYRNLVQDYRLDMHTQELHDNAQMFSDLLGGVEHLEEHVKSLPDNALGLNISEEDEYMIAQLLYLEAGADWCSYELQKAVVSVFFNHMIRYGRNVHQAIYYPGAFSVASRVKYTVPSARCRMAVRDVLEHGTTVPRNVMYFQTGGYHSGAHPYRRIQNVYFSTM